MSDEEKMRHQNGLTRARHEMAFLVERGYEIGPDWWWSLRRGRSPSYDELLSVEFLRKILDFGGITPSAEIQHASDCGLHNAPTYPPEECICDCGAEEAAAHQQEE